MGVEILRAHWPHGPSPTDQFWLDVEHGAEPLMATERAYVSQQALENVTSNAYLLDRKPDRYVPAVVAGPKGYNACALIVAVAAGQPPQPNPMLARVMLRCSLLDSWEFEEFTGDTDSRTTSWESDIDSMPGLHVVETRWDLTVVPLTVVRDAWARHLLGRTLTPLETQGIEVATALSTDAEQGTPDWIKAMLSEVAHTAVAETNGYAHA